MSPGLRPKPGEVPARGTAEYAWWFAGAEAEAAARKEGRSKDGLEVRDLVDAFAEHWSDMGKAEIATLVYDIVALSEMPFRQRLHAAMRVLRGRM